MNGKEKARLYRKAARALDVGEYIYYGYALEGEFFALFNGVFTYPHRSHDVLSLLLMADIVEQGE